MDPIRLSKVALDTSVLLSVFIYQLILTPKDQQEQLIDSIDRNPQKEPANKGDNVTKPNS